MNCRTFSPKFSHARKEPPVDIVRSWLICTYLHGDNFRLEWSAVMNARSQESGLCQMFWSLWAEYVQFLSQRRSGAVLMECRQGEGQTNKHGLYQRKRSDRVLTTYTRYVPGWAASEEFWGGVKHDLVYERWGRVLQLSVGPFVVFQEDV